MVNRLLELKAVAEKHGCEIVIAQVDMWRPPTIDNLQALLLEEYWDGTHRWIDVTDWTNSELEERVR